MNPGIRWRGCRTALIALTGFISFALPATSKDKAPQKTTTGMSIGGEPVVTLQRPAVSDKHKPQFLAATVMPGRGMALLQIKAYLPGKGEVELLNSPSLSDAVRLLDHGDDQWGNEVFKIGGAI